MRFWSVAMFTAAAAIAAALCLQNESFRIFSSEGKRGLIDFEWTWTPSLKEEITSYSSLHNQDDDDRNQTMVNHYYNLATQFYEYGWGTSFHFAHTLKGEQHEASIRRHERRIADTLNVKPGGKVADIGCGVGGPARYIAKHLRSHVSAVTLNQYQVDRARNHTQTESPLVGPISVPSASGEERTLALEQLVEFHQGDFTQLSHTDFPSNSFDGAYAIESTVHAPRLEDVYGEVFRILRPGAIFSSFEWISTEAYNKSDERHAKVMHDIVFGNGLPPVRNIHDVKAAAEAVGFKVLADEDLAADNNGTIPWYSRLEMAQWSYWLTHVSCRVMEFLGLAPEGTTETHAMLLHAAHGLPEGGRLGIFTTMWLVTMQKPL